MCALLEQLRFIQPCSVLWTQPPKILLETFTKALSDFCGFSSPGWIPVLTNVSTVGGCWSWFETGAAIWVTLHSLHVCATSVSVLFGPSTVNFCHVFTCESTEVRWVFWFGFLGCCKVMQYTVLHFLQKCMCCYPSLYIVLHRGSLSDFGTSSDPTNLCFPWDCLTGVSVWICFSTCFHKRFWRQCEYFTLTLKTIQPDQNMRVGECRDHRADPWEY